MEINPLVALAVELQEAYLTHAVGLFYIYALLNILFSWASEQQL